jgi:hypothetical protein
MGFVETVPIDPARGSTEARRGTPVDPVFLRLLSQVPPDILASFTASQLEAMARVSMQSKAPHLMDFLVSLPFFGRRFYLRFSLGRERRSYDRLLREKQVELSKTILVWGAAAWLTVSTLVLASLVTLYVFKSALGINLMRGRSPFHFVYELVFIG